MSETAGRRAPTYALRAPSQTPLRLGLFVVSCVLLVTLACSVALAPREPVRPVDIEARDLAAAADREELSPPSDRGSAEDRAPTVVPDVAASGPVAGAARPEIPASVTVGLVTDAPEMAVGADLGPLTLKTAQHFLEAPVGSLIRPDGEPEGLAFRVQVAALKDEVQADRLAASLARRLATEADAVFDAESDLYKVRVGRYAERAAAEAVAEQLRALGLTESWVMREAQGLEGAGFLVRIGGKTFRLAGRRLQMESASAIQRWQGKRYRGQLELYLNDRGTFNVINRVDLEDYLRGVVPRELGPAQYPQLEALKAQAIAARTYTLRNLGEFQSEGYDICGTPRCQVYGGVGNEHGLSDRAIAETAGQVLLDHGGVADSLYSATCGGHTENVEIVFPEKHYDYLRGVPCIEWSRVPEVGGDAGLAATLMPRLLPGDEPDPTRSLERRLRELATRAGIAVPRDALSSLEPREVRRFVASLYDLVVDARIFADAAELEALVADPPAVWSAEDLRLAGYFAGSGWLSAGASGKLQAAQTEELLYQLAVFVRLLEVESGHFRDLRDGRLVLHRDADPTALVPEPANLSLELGESVPFFRRYGDRVQLDAANLRAGDPLDVLHVGGVIVGVVQAAAGLPTSGQRRGRSPWSRFRSDGQLARLVAEKHPGLMPDRLEVLSRGVSGRVRELAVEGTLDGRRVRVIERGLAVRWLVDVPDTLFTVQRVTPQGRSPGWLFKGRGWGHGVGMCQVGAVEMARHGSSFRDILDHYYSGLEITSLGHPASGTVATSP